MAATSPLSGAEAIVGIGATEFSKNSGRCELQQAAMAVATGFGVNGIAEAVRVLRGTSTNQPDAVENVLVTAGTAVPTSGLILGLCQ